ncbi:hypothetical protein K438DRAFT_1984351 [Mycena galopus ATCC 62051]|nr:hypothetical protein K438DRAFT_1984351 [Mycena galopus ATCC 62051]
MTHPSAAQKRKKRREQKLLEEEQQILETAEKARQAPVSTFRPLPSPAAPVLVSRAPAAPHSVSTQPLFDPTLDDTAATPIHSVRVVPTPTIPPCIPQPAAPREARTPPPPALPRFPVQFLPYQIDAGPPPPPLSQWPDHVGAFVYGPNQSWADDIPQPAPTITPVACYPSTQAPPSRRLLLGATYLRFRSTPPTVPLLPPPPPPLEAWPCNLSLRPADLLGLVPLHLDDPIHPGVVPLEALPPPSLCLFPDDHLPSEFPADTEYGPVMHELAHTCSRALPPALDVASYLCDVVWPPVVYPDGAVDPNPDARLDLLGRLPPDHLVFLCAIAHMGYLEHHFALLFNPAIMEFAHRWVHHCELVGELG